MKKSLTFRTKMHDNIKRFERTGWTDDKAATRENLIRELELEMRDKGYAPSIDNDPQFTASYIPEKEAFAFGLSVYGVFVGKEKAWQVSGVTNGKMIWKSTPQSKSRASSNTAESK